MPKCSRSRLLQSRAGQCPPSLSPPGVDLFVYREGCERFGLFLAVLLSSFDPVSSEQMRTHSCDVKIVTKKPRTDTRPRSRGAMRPSCAGTCPRKTEGAGKTGCALHPRSHVQDAQSKTHTSIQVQRKHSG